MKHIVKVTAALALVAGLAHAQVSNNEEAAVSLKTKRIATINQTSATEVLGAPVTPFDNLNVYCVGTAASTSVTLQYYSYDNVLVGTGTSNCTTTANEIVSRTAGTFGFSSVAVSPSAGLSGVNSVRTVIVRTPSK